MEFRVNSVLEAIGRSIGAKVVEHGAELVMGYPFSGLLCLSPVVDFPTVGKGHFVGKVGKRFAS